MSKVRFKITNTFFDVKISNNREIIDFRNLITHDYFSVDPIMVWEIITIDLPLLKKEISNLIQ